MKQYGQRDILLRLVSLLNKHRIVYLLTGSYAVSVYGHPRATHDIDFVVEVEPEAQPKIIYLIKDLGKDYLADSREVKAKIKHQGQFNLYHIDTGIKVDFWINTKKEFQQKNKRKLSVSVNDMQITLISPEDLILKKLEWCKAVFSERHFRDCVGIWEVRHDKLDINFLEDKAKDLGVIKLLEDVKQGKY